MTKIKFLIAKSWLRNNHVLKNQMYWKSNLDPLIIENQELKVCEDATRSVIP